MKGYKLFKENEEIEIDGKMIYKDKILKVVEVKSIDCDGCAIKSMGFDCIDVDFKCHNRSDDKLIIYVEIGGKR